VDSYVTEESVEQLESPEKLDGVTHIYGMPDLDPGPGCPIGAVTVTDGVIHPHLIGDDIGCDMSFVKTGILISDFTNKKITKIAGTTHLEGKYNNITKLDDLLSFNNGKYANIINDYPDYVGTVGAGNNFAELQIVDKIYDNELAQQYEINMNEFYLTVHSGSRGLGKHILELFENKEISIDEYKDLHNFALLWAKNNRVNISDRFLKFISPQANINALQI